MYLAINDVWTFFINALIVFFTAFTSATISVICGITLAYLARPKGWYVATLALLLIPFASGSTVWAYSYAFVADITNIKSTLLTNGTELRSFSFLVLSLSRTIPLGTFFCATLLHRYVADIHSYVIVHKINFVLFLLTGIKQIPVSIVLLIGAFSGAIVATESSIPIFIYRANPGTPPESINILLSRLFREMYATSGGETIVIIAGLGILISVSLVGCSFLGARLARKILLTLANYIQRRMPSVQFGKIILAVFSCLLVSLLVPSVVFFLGIISSIVFDVPSITDLSSTIYKYSGTLINSVLIGITIMIISIAIAIKLRYSKSGNIDFIEKNQISTLILVLPAFLPVMTIVALIGTVTKGESSGFVGYLTYYIAQILLHYPIFQFMAFSIIASIPKSHVEWQRNLKLSFLFSLITDGYKRNRTLIYSLVGIAAVQIVTDGSLSRWFNNLINSTEEAFYSSLFGRNSNAYDAEILAMCITLSAIILSIFISSFYMRDLYTRLSDA